MVRTVAWFGILAAAAVGGCASYPVPVQRMADAEAATRSAQDLGAATSPQGQLHLKLAEEEIARAKQLIANSDNERADYVLLRAKADGELAVAEAKDTTAEQQDQQAKNKVGAIRSSMQPTSASITTTSTTATTTITTSTSTTSSGGPK
jgi:hypothetical protein